MFDASSAAGTDSPMHTCSSAHSHTLSHILPGTHGLVFPAPVTFNEEEKVSRGRRTVCERVSSDSHSPDVLEIDK